MILSNKISHERLGEILLRKKSCSQGDIDQALDVQKRVGGRIGSILPNLGAITEDNLLTSLSIQFQMPLLRHDQRDIQPCLPEGLELSFFKSFKLCVGILKDDTELLIVANPLALEAIGRVEMVLDEPLPLLLGSEAEIDNLLDKISEENSEGFSDESSLYIEDELDKLKELASEAPVIKLVNRIISQAVEIKSSDIHFELFKNSSRARVRVDGLLKTIERIPQSLQLAVIARLKLISGMNIAEGRLPQDGRISLRIAGKEIDIRSSSVPTSFGESFVFRLLGKEDINYSLDSLGFYPDHMELIRSLVNRPNGIFLTTGPTGSGKTTTLYSVLSEINTEQCKIITVEDPVEYELEGVSQIHVHEKIEYTFAKALRSILRQDPDIIMIGEIRDKETADIAIQSSLTGHLVLSTLHTNSALASITRLRDMGVETFLLKASITGLMAQRLVRKLCRQCAKKMDDYHIIEKTYNLDLLIEKYPHLVLNPMMSVGCDKCNNTGYSGRLVIAEIAPFEERLKAALDDVLWRENMDHYGYRTMQEDGLLKFIEGLTSINEVVKAIG